MPNLFRQPACKADLFDEVPEQVRHNVKDNTTKKQRCLQRCFFYTIIIFYFLQTLFIR